MAQGKKLKGTPEKGLIPVTVRFTRSQLDAVEAMAEALAIDRAQFIRMGALRECGWTPPKPVPVLPLPKSRGEKSDPPAEKS